MIKVKNEKFDNSVTFPFIVKHHMSDYYCLVLGDTLDDRWESIVLIKEKNIDTKVGKKEYLVKDYFRIVDEITFVNC
jgi:hypothetical protein